MRTTRWTIVQMPCCWSVGNCPRGISMSSTTMRRANYWVKTRLYWVKPVHCEDVDWSARIHESQQWLLIVPIGGCT
jgi:hypothetical protein